MFVSGAKDGINQAVELLPTLMAVCLCIGMFKASGALDIVVYLLKPISQLIGFPCEVLPLAVIRPISSGGALVIFEDILNNYSPDSFIGNVASVVMGSSETTFYTMAVYYSAVKIKKTRHTLISCLSADVAGFLASAAVVRIFLS